MITKHQLIGYTTYWTNNNLPNHRIMGKDRYIHAVTLYTKQVLKYSYKN